MYFSFFNFDFIIYLYLYSEKPVLGWIKYVCMYVCIDVCMYVCMYVCITIYSLKKPFTKLYSILFGRSLKIIRVPVITLLRANSTNALN